MVQQENILYIDWIEIDKHIEAINRYENLAEKIKKLKEYYSNSFKKKRKYEKR